jgi:cell wall-associated NlpC family hydrolase
MPRFTLPSLPRPSFNSRSTGVFVVALLVLSLGTAATAVTAELSDSSNRSQPAADSYPDGSAGTGPTAAPRTSPAAHSVKLSTKPKKLVESTLLVTERSSLTTKQVRKLRHVKGVKRTLTVTAGRASVDGHQAEVVGVNPQTFRPWTPRLTAISNRLWASVSRGELTASFDMGHDAKLPLGSDVAVGGHRGVTPIRIGAFASVGMAGVDAVVSQARAHQIGLQPRSGLLLSAPGTDPLAVRKSVLGVIGKKKGHVELLRQVVVTRDAGEFLTRAQITGFLNAAASRVGAPYVWGAEGPNSFDCSGLVQWSFARIGIQMPRVAQEQFFTGPHVPYADARPGDLLFWHYDPTNPTFVDHVAIYVGNGQMLVAPHTGDVVKLAPVPLSNMAGVVRVDPALAGQIA